MASRQSMMPPRNNLTLTEELEKLEQSITLTLQEIDHNFSRAHRIVTSKIIPVVEQYARNSDAVWEGSKFWKEFFEASANVSLSGYEEATDQDETADLTETTQTQDEHDKTPMRARHGSETRGEPHEDDSDEITIPDSPSLTINANTTPKNRRSDPSQKRARATAMGDAFADYPSPYETLKQDLEGTAVAKGKARAVDFGTPGPNVKDYAEIPGRPSPFMSTTKDAKAGQTADPLLHRVLDKNYRVQATPRTAQKRHGGHIKATASTMTKVEPRKSNNILDSSPMSSPIAAPQLRAEIFGTPVRSAPRTPGLSVQKSKGRTPFDSSRKAADGERLAWDSDSETSESLGLSPPKTMHFHIPQSRLLQTPAHEASRRIVEDILATAGGASVTDEMSELQVDDRYDQDELELGDDSPSVVRAAKEDLEGDSF
ncbi:MAG: DASH complex subunit ask1 [Chrysothrix sp. TS-e1954]|nr:MAG: DASH complex subunit ask1 [Chrysothrix sp. TS-e1954]